MITLISFCDLSWWHVLLSWLLPFLLGLWLGWLLWGKFKRLYLEANEDLYDCDEKYEALNDRYNSLKKRPDKDIADDTVPTANKEIKKVKQKAQAGPGNIQTLANIPVSKFNALDSDNLQIIEGIGPKMSEFLHNNGINNWETLAKHDGDYLHNLLNKEGTKYRVIDPSSWQKQAELASNAKWAELIELQKKIAIGKSKNKSEETDSKLEKIMIRLGILKRWKKDDLKAVEGIGPKIEQLFHDAGITTWESLAESKIEKLNEILEKAGKRYSLAKPDTWPEQARLADAGNWDELVELQDKLTGGRKA